MQQENLSLLAFQKRLRTEKACQKHLVDLRWPQGYRCPRCQHDQAYLHRTRHLYACKACGYQTSLTAGSIFHKTRTPLRKWFWMIFLMGRQQSGTSRLSLQRILVIRTYKTVESWDIRSARADRSAVRTNVQDAAAVSLRAPSAHAGARDRILGDAPDVPPLSADFTFFGGLYRDAHLLVTDEVQISPLDYGSPGIYLKTTKVGSDSANVQVTAVLANATTKPQTVTVRSVITDAATNIVALLTNVVTLPPATASNIVATTTIVTPHLWNGLSDPYLYQTFTEVWRSSIVVDVVAQPLGFRYFSVDANNGFFLNGQHYDLHGVSMHQDWLDCGWAVTDEQRNTNFMLLKELGATAVRLSHYEHDDYTYQLADQNGIILWSEIPLVNRITESPAFYANARQQLIELIRQRYNHPSVVCWGVFNEITMKPGPKPVSLVRQLALLAAQEDPTRFSTSAANASDDEPSNWCTELNSFPVFLTAPC